MNLIIRWLTPVQSFRRPKQPRASRSLQVHGVCEQESAANNSIVCGCLDQRTATTAETDQGLYNAFVVDEPV